MARQAMSADLADLSARIPLTVGEIVYSKSFSEGVSNSGT
ncbi:hypothetical protein GEOBRER4_n1294 [Citrifermentans bremense]|uniref:Uncharacterized protein n=1 Tax=Citrifermentans bremense TaxID=60035 RepID=A0A7R7FT56_9BACT|nr:hypothetical protein GEOBRER4_n1294 [Citrifermentans bremense]